MFSDYILLVIIFLALLFDLRERRIPNLLIVLGLISAAVYHGYTAQTAGLIYCGQGLLTGMLLLFIPFFMGGMGAGDVKLLGVIGAIKGYLFAISTFLWMALWGGLIAILLLIYQRKLRETFSRLGRGLMMTAVGAMPLSQAINQQEFSLYYPYALAIALGVLSSYVKAWC